MQRPLQLGDSLAHQILMVAPVLQLAASGHLKKPSRRNSGWRCPCAKFLPDGRHMRAPGALPTSNKLSAAAEKSMTNRRNHNGRVTLVLPETLPCREEPAKMQAIRPSVQMDRSHSLRHFGVAERGVDTCEKCSCTWEKTATNRNIICLLSIQPRPSGFKLPTPICLEWETCAHELEHVNGILIAATTTDTPALHSGPSIVVNLQPLMETVIHSDVVFRCLAVAVSTCSVAHDVRACTSDGRRRPAVWHAAGAAADRLLA